MAQEKAVLGKARATRSEGPQDLGGHESSPCILPSLPFRHSVIC